MEEVGRWAGVWTCFTEPTVFADGSDVGSERKQGVRDDFKFLAQAIGGIALPFTELSCERGVQPVR